MNGTALTKGRKVTVTHDLFYRLLRLSYRNEVMKRKCLFRMDEELELQLRTVAGCFVSACKDSYDPRKTGFIMVGGTGVGKTVMLHAVYRVLAKFIDRRLIPSYEGDRYPRFVMATEVVRMAVHDPEGYERLKNCERLMIDDLGMEPTEVISYGMPLHPIEELLAYRYERRARTIVASNFPYACLFCNDSEHKAKYPDPRLEDRLHETMYVIRFKGKSHR